MQGFGDDNFIFACIILDPIVKEKEHEISELSGETNRDSDSGNITCESSFFVPIRL